LKAAELEDIPVERFLAHTLSAFHGVKTLTIVLDHFRSHLPDDCPNSPLCLFPPINAVRLEIAHGQDYLDPVRRRTSPRVELPLEMLPFDEIDLGLVHSYVQRFFDEKGNPKQKRERGIIAPGLCDLTTLQTQFKMVCSKAYKTGFLDWIQQAEGCAIEERGA
jgi:hypothetical protein